LENPSPAKHSSAVSMSSERVTRLANRARVPSVLNKSSVLLSRRSRGSTVCNEGHLRLLLCRQTAHQAIGMTMFLYIHHQVLHRHHLSIHHKRILIPFLANHHNLPHATEAFGCLTRPCQISPRCSSHNNNNHSNRRRLPHLPLASQPLFHPLLRQRTILLSRPPLLVIRRLLLAIPGQTQKRRQRLPNRSSIDGRRCQRCVDQTWSSVQVRSAWHHESRRRQSSNPYIY
jgi:hypothetical protein